MSDEIEMTLLEAYQKLFYIEGELVEGLQYRSVGFESENTRKRREILESDRMEHLKFIYANDPYQDRRKKRERRGDEQRRRSDD